MSGTWSALGSLLSMSSTAFLHVSSAVMSTVLCHHSPRWIFLTFGQDPLYSRWQPLSIYAASPLATLAINTPGLLTPSIYFTSGQFCFHLSRATCRSHPQLIHSSPHLSCLHIKGVAQPCGSYHF